MRSISTLNKMTTLVNELVITQQMADAINDYADREIISEDMIGKTFFKGLDGDGSIGIDIAYAWNSEGTTSMSRRFINFTGDINDLNWNRHSWETDGGGEIGEITVEHLSPDKATTIIGALYGFCELPDYVKIDSQIAAEAISLRFAMGLVE